MKVSRDDYSRHNRSNRVQGVVSVVEKIESTGTVADILMSVCHFKALIVENIACVRISVADNWNYAILSNSVCLMAYHSVLASEFATLLI